jgi:hypothetical protein
MLDIREQVCSLCHSKAKFYFVDHGDKKYFDCTNCKRYFICIDAENYVSDATEEVRVNMAEHARKSANDEVTVISIEAVSPYKHVVAKYVKRSEFNV